MADVYVILDGQVINVTHLNVLWVVILKEDTVKFLINVYVMKIGMELIVVCLCVL